MNSYKEREVLRLLQDEGTQRNIANNYIGRFAGWYFLMMTQMTFFKIRLSRHG